MRKSCVDCVRRHLGSAAIVIKEMAMGYPHYDIYAIGELEHAADESLALHRDLALVIREHRILWMEDSSYLIPFEELNAYIKDCVLATSQSIPFPAIPKEVLNGVDLKSLHGDTRP